MVPWDRMNPTKVAEIAGFEYVERFSVPQMLVGRLIKVNEMSVLYGVGINFKPPTVDMVE